MKDHVELTESELEDLSSKFMEGDVEAFSKLYDFYVENIYRFIYFKTNTGDAEDLTEIVFIKVWENRFKFDLSKSSFSTWIYTIARNTVIDHYRSSKSVEKLSEMEEADDISSNPKELTEKVISAKKIRQAINKLSPQYRDLLLLRFIEDLSYKEIAEVLGKSEGSLRIMQFRAMRDLKKILQKMGFDQ